MVGQHDNLLYSEQCVCMCIRVVNLRYDTI